MRTEDFINNLVKDLKPVKTILPIYLSYILWIFFSCVYIFTLSYIESNFSLEIYHKPPIFELLIITGISLSATLGVFLHSIPGSHGGLFVKIITSILFVLWLIYLGNKFYFQKQFLLKDINSIGFLCVGHIILVSLVPFFTLYYFTKKMAPIDYRWTGVFLFLSSTSLATLDVQMQCKNVSPSHIFLYHTIPIIVFGMFGFKLGKKLFKNYT